MHYYSFHVGDYLSHTSRLSMMEDLCYRRLLDLYYQTEAPISLDIPKVARAIGFRDEIQIVSDVLSDFFLKSEEGYRNKRCDEEISAYHAKAERAKNANKKRWASETDLKSDADQIPTNNQEPITNNQEEDYLGDAAEAANAQKTSGLHLEKQLPAKELSHAEKTFGMCREEITPLWEKFKAFHLNPENSRDPAAWFFAWRSWVAEEAKRKATGQKKAQKPEWDYDLHMKTGNGFRPTVKPGEEDFWKYVQ